MFIISLILCSSVLFSKVLGVIPYSAWGGGWDVVLGIEFQIITHEKACILSLTHPYPYGSDFFLGGKPLLILRRHDGSMPLSLFKTLPYGAG